MSFSDSEQQPSPLRQVGTYIAVAIVSVVLTLLTLRFFPGLILPGQMPSTPQVQEIATQPATQAASPRSFVAAAIRKVGPAVVRIDTERTIATNPTPFFNDPFFRDFFGYDGFPSQPREFRQRGEGSGFIIDPNGIILTNAHVVSGADTVTVTLKDGRKFQGKVRGLDEPSDLAVVKIDGKNLPVAPLGNSGDVEVGDWAIAVGNPLGLDNTITLGIVSTLNRSSAQVGIPDKRLDFIQTDAAINPGNSGGPLVSDRGEVIGINTAIRPDAQGIGFAIPIDTAKAIKDTLARGEKVQHPYIGIRMLTLTPDLKEQIRNDPNAPIIPDVDGVLIMQVIPNSPAASAGLRQGDVITQMAGQKISTAEQLQAVVEKSKINQPLKVTVQRNNQTQELTIRPGELQEAPNR